MFVFFRDDFSPKFVALFTLLLFLKSFHWLSEDRVDFMERSPSISALFHIRVISLAVLLGFLDVNFIIHAYQSTLTKGASVQLVFGKYRTFMNYYMGIGVYLSDINCGILLPFDLVKQLNNACK